MLTSTQTPVLGFAARSGTGKTTLLRALLPRLRAQGLRVGVVKHAHHDFEIDQPGKDSFELRKAGAAQMLITSRERWALMVDLDDVHEPTLTEALSHLDHRSLDLILVEGFKDEPFPKIEVRRRRRRAPLLHSEDESVIAVVTDEQLSPARPIPVLDINQPDAIAAFIGDCVASGVLVPR